MEQMMSPYVNLAGVLLFNLVAALLIFIAGRMAAQALRRLLERVLAQRGVEKTLGGFLGNIAYYVMLAAVCLAALNQIGINTTSFLAVLGAAGLAVGLALKDSLGNFSAGVMLVFFRPFKVGDFVTAGGVSGSVKEISIFSTELTTPDNQKVVVPNSAIMGNVITNVTAHATRRLDLLFGISYGDDMARAKEIIAAIIAAEPRVLREPAPLVAVAELAESSVNIVARPWVDTSEYWAVRFDLIERVKRAFDQEGITIPFPQQDVHLHGDLPASGER
jgi:small conductance mechanosensitive channel